MKRTIGIVSSLLLSALLASCSIDAGNSSESTAAAKTSGTGIEGYKALSVSTEEELSALDNRLVCKDNVIVKTKSDFDSSQFSDLGANILGSFSLDGATYWHLEKAGGTVQLVSDLQNTRGVYYAEHELKSYLPENSPYAVDSNSGLEVELNGGSKDIASIAAVLNDPYTWGAFGQFELTGAINAYSSYDVGSNTVYVVDIDTGVNRIHEDMVDSDGSSIVVRAMSAFDMDNSGNYIGDNGSFIAAGDNWDDVGHGSHTAGTMVALGNNGKGVAGVCWKNARLLSYKCFCSSGQYSGCDWAVYGGFYDMVAWKKAQGITNTIPVNMSLGGASSGSFEAEMIAYALDNGFVICASMGNDGQNRIQYPAAYAGVIAVGAATSAGKKVPFSCMGKHCSVMGPGYNILSISSQSNTGYVDMSGTSMSCPFVTGTVAYLLSFNPTMKADQIKTLLEETATDMGDSGFDEDTGWGLVNVYAAAKRVKEGDIPASGSVYSAGALRISVENTNSSYNSNLSGYNAKLLSQPVYLYDSNGEFVAYAATDTVTGSAVFHLLPPGTYSATTSYKGTAKSISISIGGTSDVSGIISYNVDIS